MKKINMKNIFIVFILCSILVFLLILGVAKDNKANAKTKEVANSYNKKQWEEQKEKDRIKDSLPKITCWGDSITLGAGGGGVTYPKVISQLTGLTVYNMGVGGENTITIACRQGARHMMVNNIVIPSTTEKVEIGGYKNFFDEYGKLVTPLLQDGYSGINICSINGIEGILSKEREGVDNTTLKYYFKRNKLGEEMAINEPTPIITNASLTRKDDIAIIFIGQNGGYDNLDDLVAQQRAMINYTGHDKFIILGLTTSTASYRKELEDRMLQEYGNKYINLREYLSTNGMKDAGLIPTETDLAQMMEGKVPDSLLSDEVHGNHYFYELIGKQVYNKILELGYLNDEQKEYLGIK